ncbi:hypothetical protein ACLMJK_008097 [Lecanora helva]
MSALTARNSFNDSLSAGAGSAQDNTGLSLGSFFASLASGLIVFGIEMALFFLLNGKLARIYIPRTFLVPQRERIFPPPAGFWQWIKPVFQTSNSAFMEKCGLDAYFFLRYLRTLLKVFIPGALVILPILLPINAVGGKGSHSGSSDSASSATNSSVTGLDRLAWGNVRSNETHRYWAHLVLAVGLVAWTCYVFFDELKGYIRLRQAYLTSPQHRLRASATTVLVTAIPPKWCTFEALDGLYDVFPGGIRNIWINRNFDTLNDKVKRRNKIASILESAETSLIKNAKKVHLHRLKEAAKRADKKGSNMDATTKFKAADNSGVAMGQADGISSGNPHQVQHTLDEALAESSGDSSRDRSPERRKPLVPIPVFGQGIEAIGHRVDAFGKTVFGGLKTVEKGVDDRFNTTGGFVLPTPATTATPEGSQGNASTFGLHDGRRDSMSEHSDRGQDPHEHRAHDATIKADQYRHHHQSQSSDGSTVRQSTSEEDPSYPHSRSNGEGQGLGIEGAPTGSRTNINSPDLNILRNPQRLGEAEGKPGNKFKFWNRGKLAPYGIPSPTPRGQEEDEFPLSRPSPMTPGCNPQATVNGPQTPNMSAKPTKKSKSKPEIEEKTKAEIYPVAYREDFDPESGKPVWQEYVEEKDRDTMRLPIFGWQWMISLPLLGEKVDTIKHCRQELARLNLEIEKDQKEPEKFPLMSSAFVQFNHQVAAHMACQAVSHHVPNHMAPRTVEISPDDVIWDNMSIKWWESYLRTGAVTILIVAMIIGWAFPVTFTGLLSQIDVLAERYEWLHWLTRAPAWVLSILQGILPQAMLGLLLLLLPAILRFLARTQGAHTGMTVELSVQQSYFAFLFVQVFLVVSISTGISNVITEVGEAPGKLPTILATNLPRASNYFFSYLLLQALSTSAGALVQVLNLVKWFILAPLLDSTARQKWRRQTRLPDVQWGTFFPVYTNFACIGIIYSVISPLILVFCIITFSLFWLVYRYNTLYVTKFRFDTGGLLYPAAINQLFVGLYFMELCLIGLFLLVQETDSEGKVLQSTACKAQAVIMTVVLIFTVMFQWLLNKAFAPLFRYLPITLEDEAVERDEAFARAQEKRWHLEESEPENERTDDVQKDSQRRSQEGHQQAENIELADLDAAREGGKFDPRRLGNLVPEAVGSLNPIKASWADRSRNRNPKSPATPGHSEYVVSPRTRRHHKAVDQKSADLEAQNPGTKAIGEALFSGINDEIEDLTPDERDKLVQRAFQHEALRARRPVVWIPRDDLGVSDDEVRRTQEFSDKIWISNEFTGLDGKGRVTFKRSPPDFSEIDLIEL